nr:transcription factor bHLH104-like [Tanacetum cinerariifolium]
MTISDHPLPRFIAPHPVAYQAGANKMPVFPGYGSFFHNSVYGLAGEIAMGFAKGLHSKSTIVRLKKE